MAVRVYNNNASTTLNGAISNSATTITLTDTSDFPTPGGSEIAYATIDDGTNVEIITYTGISTNDLTGVTRGAEGTTASAFATGTIVEQRVTEASLTDVLQADESPQLQGDLDLNTNKITTTETNGDIVIDSDGTGNIIFQNDASELVRIEDDGKLRWGDSTGITNSDFSFISLNALFSVANNRTDATNKFGIFSSGHYTNSEEPVVFSRVSSTSSHNDIIVGGGSSSGNSATRIFFYGAANNTTTTGSEICRFTTNGLSFDGGSNFLNDYEEGTFTLGCEDSSSNASATTATADYIRIGSLVYITGALNNIDTTGLTGTDDIRFTGLPVAPSTTNRGQFIEATSLTSAVLPLTHITASTTYFRILNSDPTASSSFFSVNDFSDDVSDIRLSFWYHLL